MIKLLLIISIGTISSGCVSQKSQHYSFNGVKQLMSMPEMDINHPNHKLFDETALRLLNQRELLLNQE